MVGEAGRWRAHGRRSRRRPGRLSGWRGVVAVLAVLALAAAGIWAVFYSTLLSVTDVRVDGASRLIAGQVERSAEVPMGEPLATLDLAAIAERVGAIPGVRSVSVVRHWPHTVLVRIDERVPVAVVATPDGRRGVDAFGVMFRLAPGEQSGLPRLAVGSHPTPEVLAEAGRVAATLPAELAGRVRAIAAASRDSITLRLRGGDEVRWGSAEHSAKKARVLTVLLRRPATVYDVSAPGFPSIDPG